MINDIFQFIHNLSNTVSVTNPVGLAVIFALVVFADVGVVIPFIIEPALFLITFQSGPFSLPVLLFVMMLTLGRQGGTAILYWLSRLVGVQLGRLIRRLFPDFAARFSKRLQQFERSLGQRQSMALAVARLTPGLVQVSTVAAGSLRIGFPSVMVAALISGIIYDVSIVFLGGLAHYGLRGINPDYSIYMALSVGVLIGVVFLLIDRIGRVRKRRSSPKP
jgi:membrane protein DedA with SNARE-associated domain